MGQQQQQQQQQQQLFLKTLVSRHTRSVVFDSGRSGAMAVFHGVFIGGPKTKTLYPLCKWPTPGEPLGRPGVSRPQIIEW